MSDNVINETNLDLDAGRYMMDPHQTKIKENTLREFERQQKINEEIAKEHVEGTSVTNDGVVKTPTGVNIIGHLGNSKQGKN